MTVLYPVNSTFREALKYCTYCLYKTSQKYYRHTTRKISSISKSLEISMKTQHLNPSYVVIILSFLGFSKPPYWPSRARATLTALKRGSDVDTKLFHEGSRQGRTQLAHGS